MCRPTTWCLLPCPRLLTRAPPQPAATKGSKGSVAAPRARAANPMKNRAATGLKAKPMPATATSMVKEVWRSYFFGGRAARAAEAEEAAKAQQEQEAAGALALPLSRLQARLAGVLTRAFRCFALLTRAAARLPVLCLVVAVAAAGEVAKVVEEPDVEDEEEEQQQAVEDALAGPSTQGAAAKGKGKAKAAAKEDNKPKEGKVEEPAPKDKEAGAGGAAAATTTTKPKSGKVRAAAWTGMLCRRVRQHRGQPPHV